MEPNGNSLIITIINKGFSGEVMEAARSAGARGGTIVNARGTGSVEIAKFLGIVIEPEKEMILILTDNQKRQDIMTAMYQAAGLMTHSAGFSFSVPVDEILGAGFSLNFEKEPETPDAEQA